MKKFFLSSVLFFLLINSSTVLAEDQTVKFQNFLGTGSITNFLENILIRMQSIVAYLSVLFIVIGGILYLLAGTSGNDKLTQIAKASWTTSLIGLTIAIAGPAILKKLQEILLKDGKMPTNLDDTLSLQEIVTNILNFLLSIFGTLAIISLTVSAIMYILSFGDQKKVSEIIKNSLWGVLIAGSSLIIVNQIITFITK